MSRNALLLLVVALIAAVAFSGCKPPATGTEGTGVSGPVTGGTTPTTTPEAEKPAGDLSYPEGYECLADPDCKWLEENANAEMASALSAHPQIDVVFGHNDPSAHGAYMAARQEGVGRESQIAFIGIDANPEEGLRYVKEGVLAATFDYPTGGSEAVQVARRILGGAEVPKNIALGTKVYTKDNVEAGGEVVPPDPKEGWTGADQIASIPEPELTKDNYTIGMSQCNLGEPWRVRMNAEIKACTDKCPQLTVEWKDAQGKSEQQQAHVREFIDMGVDLIIISPLEAVPLTKPVEEAMDAGIPVIVLDRKIEGDKYTCFIGGDNVMIGREAGKWVRENYPDGCKIVELQGLTTSTPAGERHQGFVEGLNDVGGSDAAPAAKPADAKPVESEAKPATDEPVTKTEPTEAKPAEEPKPTDG